MAVLLARLIPFFNPDVASYASGVTGIRWAPFLIGMAVGVVPATVFCSVIGAAALEASGWIILLVGVATIVPVVVLVVIRKRIFGEEGGEG